jgi:plasmid stabilization system protein ParE
MAAGRPLTGGESNATLSHYRRVVVRHFPYGDFYRIDPDQIAILAVYHSKRDPRGWQSRT